MNRNVSAAVANRNLDPPAYKLVAQSLYRATPAPIVPQLVKKFHAFYGTQLFITVVTRTQLLLLLVTQYCPHPGYISTTNVTQSLLNNLIC